MSTEDCRKLVSQICAIVGVRTPQIIVNEIADRERRLKHVSSPDLYQCGYIELAFRKIAGQLSLMNRKGFTSVAPLESASLRRDDIFVS